MFTKNVQLYWNVSWSNQKTCVIGLFRFWRGCFRIRWHVSREVATDLLTHKKWFIHFELKIVENGHLFAKNNIANWIGDILKINYHYAFWGFPIECFRISRESWGHVLLVNNSEMIQHCAESWAALFCVGALSQPHHKHITVKNVGTRITILKKVNHYMYLSSENELLFLQVYT